MATFDYFGETFTFAEEFPAFEYAEFLEALSEDEVDDDHAVGVALRLAVACVAEADRGRFRKVSRQNRAKIPDWLRVYRDWTAEVTERPTGEPTDSSAGLDDTPKNSESEPVATVTSLPERPVRPDLALAAARSRAV
jgi:hypothetical protein